MIYKNSTTVTGIYLNGQQIANGYKGTIQFFGQGEQIPNYLCFTSRADNNTIGFTASETVTDPISLEYSTDCETWSAWDYANEGIALNNGDKVYLKGINNVFATGVSSYSSFSFSGTTEASGNIMSLLYGDDFEGQTDLTGRNYVFYSMFRNCTSLTTAPELPATTLANHCYRYMFQNCTSLTTAPELPAITLPTYCYGTMFQNCTSLTAAPDLPATTLDSYCYYSMFDGCTSLTTAPELPATTLANYCYRYMFQNCTSLTTAPELPATTLASNCYNSMFYNCTSLTTAPELPAITLVTNCYNSMFYNCSNLHYIKAMFTTTPSTSYTNVWVSGVSSTGTFVKNGAATWTEIGVNGIPTGWTVQLYISEEPIITVTETSSTFTINVSTTSNLGTIELKVNNQLVNNPYTGSKPLYNTYYAIEATNTDSGKPSNTKTEQVLIGGTKTETPVISFNENTGVITATGNGTVQLFIIVDNTWYELQNPYQIPDPYIGIQSEYAAVATESGKQQSDYVYETIQWDGAPVTSVWRKVTDASELANGCDILVVDETHGLVFNGSIYAQGKNGIEVIITNNTIEDSADLNSCIVHYGPGYLQHGDYYIGSKSSGATWASEPATGNPSNYMTITITISNGHALIGNAGNNRLLLFNTNNGLNGGYDPTKNFYFRWYTESTLTNSPNQYFYVQVYKLS